MASDTRTGLVRKAGYECKQGFLGGIKVPSFSFMVVVDHLGTTYKLKKQMAGEKEKLIK